jgi:hypothetical protein
MYLEQASSLYERCTSGILSSCMLLHFAYADFEEQRRNNEKVSCQFHQHFTRGFFVQKLHTKLFCTHILGLNFYGARKLAQMRSLNFSW